MLKENYQLSENKTLPSLPFKGSSVETTTSIPGDDLNSSPALTSNEMIVAITVDMDFDKPKCDSESESDKSYTTVKSTDKTFICYANNNTHTNQILILTILNLQVVRNEMSLEC